MPHGVPLCGIRNRKQQTLILLTRPDGRIVQDDASKTLWLRLVSFQSGSTIHGKYTMYDMHIYLTLILILIYLYLYSFTSFIVFLYHTLLFVTIKLYYPI